MRVGFLYGGTYNLFMLIQLKMGVDATFVIRIVLRKN